ncbi:competence type IV pilus minor pilin ComGD [Bacillus sp. EAC]|uniref:competence type IV pilus minor pilin ComGD n=1 Tax=Bacillus sp. EAC TaxID=1978338 RepID=UPI000B44AEEB|nr:competence type IV pilus minor pilin ComGD [Bacillus sp. EAC]
MTRLLALFRFHKQEAKSQDGFTLVEMLMVLSLIMLLLILPITQMKKIEENQKLVLFLQMFQNDLFLTQRNAAIKQIPTRIIFFKGNYEIQDNLLNPPIVNRKYDPDILITYLSLKPPLRYTADGTISNSGTISIRYKNSEYIITFYLGSGRFKYDKK